MEFQTYLCRHVTEQGDHAAFRSFVASKESDSGFCLASSLRIRVEPRKPPAQSRQRPSCSFSTNTPPKNKTSNVPKDVYCSLSYRGKKLEVNSFICQANYGATNLRMIMQLLRYQTGCGNGKNTYDVLLSADAEQKINLRLSLCKLSPHM